MNASLSTRMTSLPPNFSWRYSSACFSLTGSWSPRVSNSVLSSFMRASAPPDFAGLALSCPDAGTSRAPKRMATNVTLESNRMGPPGCGPEMPAIDTTHTDMLCSSGFFCRIGDDGVGSTFVERSSCLGMHQIQQVPDALTVIQFDALSRGDRPVTCLLG